MANVHEELSDGTWAVRNKGVGTTTSDGSAAGLVVVDRLSSAGYFIPSIYASDGTVGTAAVSEKIPAGSTGVFIKNTHASQSITVGFGLTAAEAESAAAVAGQYTIDGINTYYAQSQKNIGIPADAQYLALKASGASTTFNKVYGQ